jgi:hypothetical protein
MQYSPISDRTRFDKHIRFSKSGLKSGFGFGIFTFAKDALFAWFTAGGDETRDSDEDDGYQLVRHLLHSQWYSHPN